MKTTICISTLLCAAAVAACATDIASAEQAQTILGGALYSDVTDTANGSVNVSDAWTETTNNNFTITMTLDVAELAKYVGSSASVWTGNQTTAFVNVTGDKQLGACFFKWSTYNGISGWHTGTTAADFTASTSTTSLHRIQELDLTGVTSAAFSLSHEDGAGTTAALTLVSATGATSYWGSNTSLKWTSSGAGVFGDLQSITYNDNLVTSLFLMNDYVGSGLEKLNASALETKAAASVPEPTTATLSLLALAGLAARRRRK